MEIGAGPLARVRGVALARLLPRNVPYLTLAFAALSLYIPFVNYGVSGELTGGDAAIAWALPREQLHQVLGVYIDSPGLGYNGATGLAAAFPALTIAVLLHALGLPTAIVARLMIALYFFLSMTGALKLFQALLPSDGTSRAAAFLGALFYGVNRYTVLLYFTAQTYFPMVYAALPWVLYGVVLGCERRRGAGIAVIVAALVFAGGAGSNPALFGVALCALVGGAAFELANGAPFRRVLAVAGGGGVLGVLCCAWWIVPLVTSIGAGLDTVSAASVPNWAEWMSQRSTFLNLFKLDGYTGADTLPYADWYGSWIGSVLGYAPLAVGLVALGTFRRRLSAVALLAFVIAAFLSKGVHEPFGWVYQALLDHVPGFSIFRSPYVKWIALEAILLALLFALGAAGLGARLRERFGAGSRAVRFALVALAVVVVAYPWPAYAGRMLSPNYSGVGFRSVVPDAYADVARILQREGPGVRTIVLQPGDAPYPLYAWGYFGEDPLDVVAETPIADFTTLLPDAPRMPARALANALLALSVRFVAVHHDVRNPIASPDPNVLVAIGAAEPVYRSGALDLYRMRGDVRPLAQTLDSPLLALQDPAATADARIGHVAPGRLDPNVGFRTPGAPLQVVVPLKGGLAPGDAAAFGYIRDETDAAQPGDDERAFVPANPLALAFSAASCGARDGLHLATPSQWRFAAHTPHGIDTTLCFERRRVGMPAIGGLTANPAGAAQFAPPNGTPLHVEAEEVGSIAGVAHRLLRPGLPFALVLPQRTERIIAVPPRDAAARGMQATVRTLKGEVVGGIAAAPAGGALPIPLATPLPAGAHALLYLSAADPAVYVALQSLRALPYALGPQPVQKLQLPVDQRALDSTALDPHAAVAPRLVATQPVPRLGATPAPLPPAVRWTHGDIGNGGSWGIGDGRIALSATADPSEVHAAGILRATDRYALSFAYSATGYAELWTYVDGDAAERVTHLTADGRVHSFAADLFPPPGSSGAYIVRLRSSVGALHVRNARIVPTGPNGIVLGWRAAPRVAGRVVALARPFPWRFDVDVADCAPCVVRIGVSDPRQWRVEGAVVRDRFISQGDSTGNWSTITTGAATWLIDAGSGTAHLHFTYVPALYAGDGLAVALVALALTVLVALLTRRAVRGSQQGREPAARRTIAQPLCACAAALAIAAPVCGAFDAATGEFAANLLFYAALALGAVLLWPRRKERGAAPHA